MSEMSADRDDGLRELGWDTGMEAIVSDLGLANASRARVVRVDGATCLVQGDVSRRSVRQSGLVVGAWILVDNDQVIPLDRVTPLKRKTTGATSDEQVLAANIDVVEVVEPLYPEPDPRRIERMLTIARTVRCGWSAPTGGPSRTSRSSPSPR